MLCMVVSGLPGMSTMPKGCNSIIFIHIAFDVMYLWHRDMLNNISVVSNCNTYFIIMDSKIGILTREQSATLRLI